MIRFLAPVALLALAACADREPRAPAPTPADTSARSPMTVNPEPPGQPAPPPIDDAGDKTMPLGPVNPPT